MASANTVQVFSADRAEPITLYYQLRGYRDGRRTLPYVVYSTFDPEQPPAADRTALFLAGGGSSGVLFARVAELCMQQGIQVYMIDLPGHTPDNLLGDTHDSRGVDLGIDGLQPARHWLRYLSYRARQAIIHATIDDCLACSSAGYNGRSDARIDIIAHSAGFLDASNISPRFAGAIEHIYVLGSGIPGLKAMKNAYAAAEQSASTSKQSLFDIIRTRTIKTGEPLVHFGSAERRSTAPSILASYQGDEHYSVVLRLLREKSLGTAIWQNAKVKLVASEGDKIAPPPRLRRAAEHLGRLGANTETFILPGDLPHMFMMFEAGATFVSEVICNSISEVKGE